MSKKMITTILEFLIEIVIPAIGLVIFMVALESLINPLIE